MEIPERPSRVLAIPILGIVIRYILTIPFVIWLVVVEYAAIIGAWVSTIPVLFKGQYPESVYEIVSDFTRLHAAYTLYYSGFTEEYPSFAISWNHKAIKVTLIALGVLMLLFGVVSNIQTAMSGNRR